MKIAARSVCSYHRAPGGSSGVKGLVMTVPGSRALCRLMGRLLRVRCFSKYLCAKHPSLTPSLTRHHDILQQRNQQDSSYTINVHDSRILTNTLKTVLKRTKNNTIFTTCDMERHSKSRVINLSPHPSHQHGPTCDCICRAERTGWVRVCMAFLLYSSLSRLKLSGFS